MSPALQIEKMTTAEKLEAMELLWADLSRSGDELASPEWHGEVLRERQSAMREGLDSYGDWSEAKQRILRRVQ